MTNFYKFTQNNSGGSFDVDDTLCHRLIIEATSENAASSIAENLGCYWNGVDNDIDCSCCGDRWSNYPDTIDLESINKDGWECTIYCADDVDETAKWAAKYGKYPIHTAPTFVSNKWTEKYEGKIKFDAIEQYAEFLSTEYGASTPDTRIFYLDGTVKEF